MAVTVHWEYTRHQIIRQSDMRIACISEVGRVGDVKSMVVKMIKVHA